MAPTEGRVAKSPV